jgi:hypothetical protein
VGEPAALEGQPGDPDRGLVGDEDNLAAGELVPDRVDHGVDPLDHVDVALAPARDRIGRPGTARSILALEKRELGKHPPTARPELILQLSGRTH